MAELQTATLAGGCFWCTEAVFQRLKGVESVQSGYTGGHVKQPSYEQVSSGETGHAEAVQIQFDPTVISFEQLLDVFFHLHDPTTLNRQGADIGTQYRSAIFFHTPLQEKIAKEMISKLEDSKQFSEPIVTEVTPYSTFYPAEAYHEDYYNKNRRQGYCQIVIDPKLQKLYKNYSNILKEDNISL